MCFIYLDNIGVYHLTHWVLSFIIFIYVFLAVLGLCCCMGFSLVMESERLLTDCGVGASHWWLLLLQT